MIEDYLVATQASATEQVPLVVTEMSLNPQTPPVLLPQTGDPQSSPGPELFSRVCISSASPQRAYKRTEDAKAASVHGL